jgi:hypothetical protein
LVALACPLKRCSTGGEVSEGAELLRRLAAAKQLTSAGRTCQRPRARTSCEGGEYGESVHRGRLSRKPRITEASSKQFKQSLRETPKGQLGLVMYYLHSGIFKEKVERIFRLGMRTAIGRSVDFWSAGNGKSPTGLTGVAPFGLARSAIPFWCWTVASFILVAFT